MKKFYLILIAFIFGISLQAQEKDTVDSSNKLQSKQDINSKEIRDFRIYPNPVVNGKLFIATFYNAEKSIQIFDILGKQVIATKIKEKELDLSKLHPGVYILKAFEKGRTATRKLVIK